jgi:hypothetical protein
LALTNRELSWQASYIEMVKAHLGEFLSRYGASFVRAEASSYAERLRDASPDLPALIHARNWVLENGHHEAGSGQGWTLLASSPNIGPSQADYSAITGFKASQQPQESRFPGSGLAGDAKYLACGHRQSDI